jgi:hypothetical protein
MGRDRLVYRTLGLFSTCYLIFTRIAPVVAIAEVKSILKTGGDQYVGPNAQAHQTSEKTAAH